MHFTSGATSSGSVTYSWLCDLFTVTGTGDDPISGERVLILKSLDASGRVHDLEIPLSVIAKGDTALTSFCVSRGFNVSPQKTSRQALQYILSWLRGPSISISERTGWLRDSLAFVLPCGQVLGAARDTVHFNARRALDSHVGTLGNLETWKSSVASLVPGNSRLELALGAAFVSPMMRFYPQVRPTIINVHGESSRGKSTAGYLFGSVWGGNPETENNFALSWRQTANHLPATFAQYSGIGLALDEMSQCPNPQDIAYVFSEGVEKARLTADIESRHRRKWRCIAWSTGEQRLEELIEDAARKGTDVQSGREARCIDVPIESPRAIKGVVESLNGFGTPRDLVVAVDTLAKTHYGHAGPLFVSKLIEQIGRVTEDVFKADIAESCEAFIASLKLPEDTDPLVYRVARVFALAAVAGSLAIEFGVVPLDPARLRRGVSECFTNWIATRGSATKTAAQSKGLVALRDFISSNRARFHPLSVTDHPSIGEIIGYETRIKGETYYLLTAGSWKAVVKNAKRGELGKQLVALGLLYTNEKGHQTKHRIGGNSNNVEERFYAISSAISRVADDGSYELVIGDTGSEDLVAHQPILSERRMVLASDTKRTFDKYFRTLTALPDEPVLTSVD